MATPVDARELLDWVADDYEPRCRVEGAVGRYGRVPGQAEPHLYGVADLANIGHTLGLEVGDPDRWAEAFDDLQGGDGTYVETPPTHDPIHATAYCLAAMELLDLAPRHPLGLIDAWRDPATVEAFLAELDWADDVYLGSHRGAGLAAIVALDPAIDAVGRTAWFDAWFEAIEARFDARSGMFGIDKPPTGDSDQIGGTFHYAFLYEHLGRPLPEPEARIDAVLAERDGEGWWHPENHLWLTLDAVYLLTRAAAQTAHRRGEVEAVVAETVTLSLATFGSIEGRRWFEEWYLGAHDLTAFVSLLAEAQRFGGEGGIVAAGRPLRLVLDERPFI